MTPHHNTPPTTRAIPLTQAEQRDTLAELGQRLLPILHDMLTNEGECQLDALDPQRHCRMHDWRTPGISCPHKRARQLFQHFGIPTPPARIY